MRSTTTTETTMQKIHHVKARTGEYSDASSVTVETYSNIRSARAHARAANNYAIEHDIHTPSYSTNRGFPARKGDAIPDYDEREAIMDANPFHPGGRCDYTGIQYSVWTQTVDPAASFHDGLARLAAKKVNA
jgi:hypothetical protein